jgi:hypothetical protein
MMDENEESVGKEKEGIGEENMWSRRKLKEAQKELEKNKRSRRRRRKYKTYFFDLFIRESSQLKVHSLLTPW